MLVDLRKLIKYEEKSGVNVHQEDYFDRLYKQRTASFRAKYSHLKQEHEGERMTSNRNNDVRLNRNRDKPLSSKNSVTGSNSLKKLQKSEESIGATRKAASSTTFRKTEDKENDKGSMLKQHIYLYVGDDKKQADGAKRIAGRQLKPQLKQNLAKTSMQALNSKTKQNDGEKKYSESASSLQKTSAAEYQLPNLEHILTGNLRALSLQLQQKLAIADDHDKDATSRTGSYVALISNTPTGTQIKRVVPKGSAHMRPQWQPLQNQPKTTKSAEVIQSSCPTTSLQHTRMTSGRSNSTKPSSTLICRSKSRSRMEKTGCDPVALYHHYLREWKNFRERIPGECAHTDLRWQIRYKLLERS